MKKQTKPISLKKQLMSAVSMMLAAAVALGSSTYAWFVNKSRAEVKDVLFQASAGKNLEISGAVVEEASHTNGTTKFSGQSAGDQVSQDKAGLLTYWSSVTPDILGEYSFSYPEYDASSTNPVYMTPVSIDGEDLELTPGSTTFFKNQDWDSTASGYNTYTEVTNNNDKYYICAQLYFRSSEDMDIYLNKAEWDNYSGTSDATGTVSYPFITQYNPSGATEDEKATYKKQAEDMAKALRIAFVTEDADPIVACFAQNSETFDTALWNTAKDGTLIASDTPIKSIDADSKIAAYGTAVTEDLTKYMLTDASAGTDTTAKTPSITGKTKLFSVEANTPKRVTVYIWLEGTDKECVNTISSYIAGVYLPFVGGIANEDNTITTYSLEDEYEVLTLTDETVEGEIAENVE